MKNAPTAAPQDTRYKLWIEYPPGDLWARGVLGQVLEGTGLHLGKLQLSCGMRWKKEANTKATHYYGATWSVPADQEEKYLVARPLIRRRLVRLCREGTILGAGL